MKINLQGDTLGEGGGAGRRERKGGGGERGRGGERGGRRGKEVGGEGSVCVEGGGVMLVSCLSSYQLVRDR